MSNSYLPGQKTRTPWLDALRALAIMLVVVCHGTNFFAGPTWVTTVAYETGLIGVELFFVLSGFLVGGILIEQYTSHKGAGLWILAFCVRRWRRTLPNYYLFLIVAIALEMACFGKVESHILPYLFLAQNLAWPIQNLYMQSWSLPVEEYFYVALPLLLAATSRIGLRRETLFVLCCATLALFSVAMRATAALSDDVTTFNLGIREVVVYRLDSFMIGVMAYHLYRRGYLSADWRVSVLGIVSVALCEGAVAGWFGDLDHSAFWKIVWPPLSSLGCAGILLGFMNRDVVPIFLLRPTRAIARWSYSMYLANSPIVISMLTWIPRSANDTMIFKVFLFASYVSATIVVAAACFKWFEMPMLQGKLPEVVVFRRKLLAKA